MFNQDTYIAVVDTIIYENNNGFYILRTYKPEDIEESFVVKVSHPKIHKGVTMDFRGKWIKDAKYGLQFKADMAFEVKPVTRESLVKHLSSGLFPGVGPVIAKRIVDFFGKEALNVFSNNIERLNEVHGLGKKKVDDLKNAWIENIAVTETMLFLYDNDISTNLANKIYKNYGRDCVNVLRQNPYLLIRDIDGVGFIKADVIAMNMGIAKDSEIRIEAAIEHSLSESKNDGHCFLTISQIKEKVKSLLKVDVEERIERILNIMEGHELIYSSPVLTKDGNDTGFYSKTLYENETYCANRIREIKEWKPSRTHSYVEGVVKKFSKENENVSSIKLSEEQEQSVIKILSSSISILTGGPGTGKSSSLRAAVQILTELNVEFCLAAPTGRAAQRMKEVIGCEAKTIHRLLKTQTVDEERGGFLHNENNPLKVEFIIIDETSMLDINLASHLLRAIPKHCQVLFVGDVDQLPPVGPGNFFKDLIDSEIVNVCKLTKIFRQAEKSQIIRYAHTINKKEVPSIESPLVKPELWKDGTTDCMFIDSGNELIDNPEKWSSLFYKKTAANMIESLYSDIIPKYLGKNVEIQVLTPLREKGSTSSKNINNIIQAKVNPPSPTKQEIVIGDRTFRIGDRVIQMKNNYQLDVFNGDIGKIELVDSKQRMMIIRFYNNKQVTYKKDDIVQLELAYSVTVHKSQGSEFPVVIIPIMGEHYSMLFNSLIYTALTRAKIMAIFVGEKSALSIAVNNVKPNERQTMLKNWLKVKELV